MILRRTGSQLFCLAAHLPPSSARLLSTSATNLAFSRRDNNRGSRSTRVTKSRPRTDRENEVVRVQEGEAAPTITSPSPVSPPWPTTTAETKLPWTAYNQGPMSVDGQAYPPPSSPAVTPSDMPPSPTTMTINVPHDPEGVLDNAEGPWSDKARELFSTPAIVVVRQLEIANVLIGFEEANKYQLMSPDGRLLGYLAEEELGFRGIMARQMLKTHRAFRATIFDPEGHIILRIRRPFSWINSKIFVSTPSESGVEGDEQVIGEVQQEWHLYRRRYNYFVKRGAEMVQVGTTDSGFLAWDFFIQNEKQETIGSINRNFAGFGRELFTDTGQYVLRFEGVVDELINPVIESPPAPDALPISSGSPATTEQQATTVNKPPPPAETSLATATASSVPAVIPLPSITFDQRACMLASAVSIDFDYFTRSRGGIGSGMGLWMPMPMGGSTTTDAGAAGEEGAAVGGAGGIAGEPSTSTDPRVSGEQDTPSDFGRWNESGSEPTSGYGGGDQGAASGSWDLPQDEGIMEDPWSQQPSAGEGGGSWSWGDLFPDE